MRTSNPWRNRAHVETPFPPTPVLAHFECALSRSAGGARRRKTATETRHKVVPEEREPLRPVRRQMLPFNTAVVAASESLIINRVSRMVPGIAPAVFSIKGRSLNENPKNPSRSSSPVGPPTSGPSFERETQSRPVTKLGTTFCRDLTAAPSSLLHCTPRARRSSCREPLQRQTIWPRVVVPW